MNPEFIQEQIARFPFWYHKIDLPFGITTPGWAPMNQSAYRIPVSLAGKRVLDIGAWDGYWTFEALKRGADQVVAIDDFSDYLGCLENSDRKAWETFDACRSILGYEDKQCQRMEASVYDVKPDLLGLFDTVFFFGTLYHLRYPLFALDRLAAVCREEIYIESAILDDFSPYRGGLGRGYPEGQMVPTLNCLMQMVRAAGFEVVEGWKLTDRPEHLSHCRGFVRGRKTKGGEHD
jgi:tRNA (mo5U34)-methyltransferase